MYMYIYTYVHNNNNNSNSNTLKSWAAPPVFFCAYIFSELFIAAASIFFLFPPSKVMQKYAYYIKPLLNDF